MRRRPLADAFAPNSPRWPQRRERSLHIESGAGAETVGAIILFGIFITVIAVLNATAVPNAGLAAEEEHVRGVLADLSDLQAAAETTAVPGKVGATVAETLTLGPDRQVGQDFFSFFLATPARATGEVQLTANYGNFTLSHFKGGNPNVIVDIGSTTAVFPFGRLSFNPHPIFRDPGIMQLEGGGLVTTTAAAETFRFAPPVSVEQMGGETRVSVQARILNGTDVSQGGTGPARLTLVSQAATLITPANANARNLTLRIETAYGGAWGAHLNATSLSAGLTAGSHFSTSVARGGAPGGLDIVTWTVDGLSGGTTNDIRLTYGLAVHGVEVR